MCKTTKGGLRDFRQPHGHHKPTACLLQSLWGGEFHLLLERKRANTVISVVFLHESAHQPQGISSDPSARATVRISLARKRGKVGIPVRFCMAEPRVNDNVQIRVWARGAEANGNNRSAPCPHCDYKQMGIIAAGWYSAKEKHTFPWLGPHPRLEASPFLPAPEIPLATSVARFHLLAIACPDRRTTSHPKRAAEIGFRKG